MMYKSQFQKIDPFDWFCGPGSHMYNYPRNAPFWFDALNGGVVYILKSQDLSDQCTIHAHVDLNRPHTRKRRGRVTHDLRHSPSEDKANRCKPLRFWDVTKHDTKF